MAAASKVLVADDDDFLMTWAFCLRTSAGVRMKQETASAVAEAALWSKGVGRV